MTTPRDASAPGRRRAPLDLLLPGSRLIWAVAGGVLALIAVVAIVWSLVPRDFYTGTNSVRLFQPVATVGDGAELCVRDLNLPADTGRVQLAVYAGTTRPALTMRVRGADTTLRSNVPAADAPGLSKVDFPIPARPSSPDSTPVTVCVSPVGGEVQIGGDPGLAGNTRPALLDGDRVDARVSVWYLPRAGEQRSLIAALPDVLARAALLRPDPIGPWVYVLLLFVAMPLLGYSAVRLMAVTVAGASTRRVPLVVALALIAFVNSAGWSLISPAFNTPDEPEHFAYAQYFAENGRPPDAGFPSTKQAYADRESLDLDASMVKSYLAAMDGRPPWLEADVDAWKAREASLGEIRRDNGGGPTAASVHSPLYYALLAPAYHVAGGTSFDELQAMRLVSALLGAVTVACVFLAFRELVPRRRWVAVAAALLVAFQPMVAFMAGSVNNDVGVNAAAALLTWLLLRGLRRGLTVRLAVGLAAAGLAVPLMKGTGYALYPAAGFALAVMAWRQLRAVGWVRGLKGRWRTELPPWLTFGGASLVLFGLWTLYTRHYDRGLLTTPSGGSPTEGSAAVASPRAYFSYLWQTFLPRLPFMERLQSPGWPFFDIYVERGFAAFGWYSIVFPHWVYVVIVVVMLALGAMALASCVRELPWVRLHAAELTTLALIVVGVFAGVAFAYYTADAGSRLSPSEQGRYAFTALIPLAAIAVAGCFAFGRRRAAAIAGGVVGAMVGLGFVAQLMAMSAFYT